MTEDLRCITQTTNHTETTCICDGCSKLRSSCDVHAFGSSVSVLGSSLKKLDLPSEQDRMLDTKVFCEGGLNDRHSYSESGGEKTRWKRRRGVDCRFIVGFLMIR